MQNKPSSFSNFLETRIASNVRAALYSLPLFVQWIIGLSFETGEAPYQAARRNMFLTLIFLALTGVFYFGHGFFRYFSPTAEVISGYLFFGLQALNVTLFALISIWQAWHSYKQAPAPLAIVEKNSGRMESFLSR